MATQVAVGTEADEVKLIRAGNGVIRKRWKRLFRRYQRPLFQTALRVLGNAEDAEDALQDGLLSAYRNLKRFEGRSQFSTWLTRIVINAALMRRARSASRVQRFRWMSLRARDELRRANGSRTMDRIRSRCTPERAARND